MMPPTPIVYCPGTTISTGRREARAETSFVIRLLRQVAGGFSRWISCVAAAIVAMRGWLSPSRAVEVVELTAGEFSVRSTEKRDAGRSETGRLRIADGKVTGPVPALL